jgi:hypothetical protein
MRHLVLALLPLLATAWWAGGCYQDASAPVGASVTVLLVDGWAPLSAVERVEVYVTEVEASTTADTLSGQQTWTRITAPRGHYDLSALPLGSTLVAGSGLVPVGVYQAVRLTVNTDSTRVFLSNGRAAKVRWPVAGEYAVPVILEGPVTATPESDLRLILEIDLARSFAANVDPLFDFVFVPAVRALDATAAGALAGTVLADGDTDGTPHPLANATVTVLAPGPGLAAGEAARIVAVGRTNPQGLFRIGYLVAGAYTVRVDAPVAASLPPLSVAAIVIVAGGESRLDVTLTGSRLSTLDAVVPPFPFPVERRL